MDEIERPSFARRLAIFLYGTQNIVGCVLALAGLGLFFGGVIDRFWWAIVVGLYATGALAVPRSEAARAIDAARFTEENLREALDETLHKVGPRLPEQARSLLVSIRDTVEALLPAMRALEGEGRLDLKSRHTLLATVTRYLPETLAAYLKLPPAFARLHHGVSKHTPQALLIDQLGMLDAQLRLVAANVFAQDFEKLAVNGRFLADKFGSVAVLD